MECSAEHPAPPIQNGRVHTRGSFNFRYGRVAIRARNPTGDWLGPSLWLMPTSSRYGSWPRSGEIDMMESIGNVNVFENGVDIGAAQFGTTLHFGPDAERNAYRTAQHKRNAKAGDSFNRDYHVYEMEWTPGRVFFLVWPLELDCNINHYIPLPRSLHIQH